MRFFVVACLLLLLLAPSSAAAQDRYEPIEQRLSTQQLQDTGLAGLSTAQLQLLNSLLSQEQAVVEQRVESTVRERVAGLLQRQPAEPVQDMIKGEFRGWVPGKVIELANGQRWRVTEGELHLRRPMPQARATVTPGMVSGWYLQVDGQSPRAKVQRLP